MKKLSASILWILAICFFLLGPALSVQWGLTFERWVGIIVALSASLMSMTVGMFLSALASNLVNSEN